MHPASSSGEPNEPCGPERLTKAHPWAACYLVDDRRRADNTEYTLSDQLLNLHILVDRYQALLNDVGAASVRPGITAHTGPLDMPILQQIRTEALCNGEPKKPDAMREQILFAQALLAITQKNTHWREEDVPFLFNETAAAHYETSVVKPLVGLARMGRFLVHDSDAPEILGVSRPKKDGAERAFWGMPPKIPAAHRPVPSPEEAGSWFTDITRKLAEIKTTLESVPPAERAGRLANALNNTASKAMRTGSRLQTPGENPGWRR